MDLLFGALKKNRQLILIVLVFLFIFLSRIPYINNSTAEAGEVWRQTDTESIARNFIKYQFNIFFPQLNYDGIPPNYVQLEFQITTFLIAILYKLFGVHIFLARLVPIGFFMFSVFFLYRTARRFFPVYPSLTVIIIYSIIPLNIFFSRAIMPEAALLCFINGAFYFFLKWLNDERFSTLIFSAVLMCLAISQKPQAAFMGLAMIALCAEKYRFRIFKEWRLLVFAAIALIPGALYYLWSGTVAEQSFVSGIALKHILPKYKTAVFSPEAIQFFIKKLPEAFGISVLALAFTALFTTFNKKERPIVYLAFAMFIEVLIIVSVIKFKYYLIMLTPVLALLTGKLLFMLWRKSYMGKAPIVLIVLIFAFNSYALAKGDFQVQQELVDAAKTLDAVTSPEDLVVIGTFDPVILTLSDRSGWRANLQYHAHIPKDMVNEMRYFMEHGANYFLVYKNRIYNDNGRYINYLNKNFSKKIYGENVVLYKLN